MGRLKEHIKPKTIASGSGQAKAWARKITRERTHLIQGETISPAREALELAIELELPKATKWSEEPHVGIRKHFKWIVKRMD